jgi:hypothetical protein
MDAIIVMNKNKQYNENLAPLRSKIVDVKRILKRP